MTSQLDTVTDNGDDLTLQLLVGPEIAGVDMHPIEDYLWMGSFPTMPDLPSHIDVVVSLSHRQRSHKVPYLHFPFDDGVRIPNKDSLYAIAHMIDGLRKAKKTVLVHCDAGLNRSGLITALSLIVAGWRPDMAIHQVRQRRLSTCLYNQEFCEWLLAQSPSTD